MLGAILAVRRRPVLAMALLGLGVQVKLTAVLLLPWLAVRIWRGHRERAWVAAGAFVAAFAPMLLTELSYPVLESIASTFGTLRYNPYFWNPWDPEIFRWNPGWLIGANAVSTWAMLGVLGWFGWRSEDRWAYLAPVLFLLLLKTSSLGQFWYVLLFPAFVAPIPERGVRAWLVAATPLMDVRSLIQLVWGPFGFVVGIAARDSLRAPRASDRRAMTKVLSETPSRAASSTSQPCRDLGTRRRNCPLCWCHVRGSGGARPSSSQSSRTSSVAISSSRTASCRVSPKADVSHNSGHTAMNPSSSWL